MGDEAALAQVTWKRDDGVSQSPAPATDTNSLWRDNSPPAPRRSEPQLPFLPQEPDVQQPRSPAAPSIAQCTDRYLEMLWVKGAASVSPLVKQQECTLLSSFRVSQALEGHAHCPTSCTTSVCISSSPCGTSMGLDTGTFLLPFLLPGLFRSEELV